MSGSAVAARDVAFVLNELLKVEEQTASMPRYAWLDSTTLTQIVDAAGTFAAEELAPFNRRWDEQGCRYEPYGRVHTPTGMVGAYRAYCEQGWPGACADVEVGGEGLPHMVFGLVQEQVCAASASFSMFAAANHCAIQCLRASASQELLKRWLPALASGSVLATMCLSEPQAGSDLGLLRSRAEAGGEGTWRVSGTKVFASGGEQDLTDNIAHLVLARLPGAPAGTRGLSLFLVPQRLEDGRRNGVRCDGIEHKMGLRASPTCVLNFEGAVGWLIGAPHAGLQALFPMMNTARLFSAMQALGIGEAAYQQARAYAAERQQGRSPGTPSSQSTPILEHADVQRMLMTQRAWNEGARAFVHWTALHIDLAASHADAAVRDDSRELLALLTPVAKGFLCENAQAVASLAVQVHGGHGYVRDTGVEQLLRDVRITTIYEGTSGIQAIDLLVRKLLPDDGRRMALLCGVIDDAVQVCRDSTPPEMDFARRLVALRGHLVDRTDAIRHRAQSDPAWPYHVASDYLRLVGHVLLAALWARMAVVAQAAEAITDEPFYRAKALTAQFYFDHLLPETQRLCAVLESPAGAWLEALQS